MPLAAQPTLLARATSSLPRRLLVLESDREEGARGTILDLVAIRVRLQVKKAATVELLADGVRQRIRKLFPLLVRCLHGDRVAHGTFAKIEVVEWNAHTDAPVPRLLSAVHIPRLRMKALLPAHDDVEAFLAGVLEGLE
ncbi:MAG: hypothetical protein AB1486_32615 [Planctomycetota bacterium]